MTHLNVNHRSPALVARFIERTLPIEFECGNDLPGLGADVTTYERADEQPRVVGKVVDDLLHRGFGYGDIAIVSMRSAR